MTKDEKIKKLIYLYENTSCSMAQCARHIEISETCAANWYERYGLAPSIGLSWDEYKAWKKTDMARDPETGEPLLRAKP